MIIGIAATEQQKMQLTLKGIPESATIHWAAGTDELMRIKADAFIDCTFCSSHLPVTHKPFLFHSPVDTLADLQATGIAGRFCAWNTFLERQLWEIAITDSTDDTWINMLTSELGWKFCVVKDEPGLVAPRIVSNIINEAWYSLQAGISSQTEIDLAMKLGTNYPYGPFEWADKIGVDNISSLLEKLTGQQSYYQSTTSKTK